MPVPRHHCATAAGLASHLTVGLGVLLKVSSIGVELKSQIITRQTNVWVLVVYLNCTRLGPPMYVLDQRVSCNGNH